MLYTQSNLFKAVTALTTNKTNVLSDEEKLRLSKSLTLFNSSPLHNNYLTKEQAKILTLFLINSGSIVSRDEIAKEIWGINNWLDKYSDWAIDRLIFLARKKITPQFKIQTVRNRGYSLQHIGSKIKVSIKNLELLNNVLGTQPTKDYLKYMNDPTKVRKVMRDLFEA